MSTADERTDGCVPNAEETEKNEKETEKIRMNKKTENGMKLCKHCQTEIPEKAKVCPNCRKKQGGIGKWIVIIIVVIILISAIAGGNKEPKKVEPTAETAAQTENMQEQDEKTKETAAKEETEAPETEEKNIFGIGETAELNDVQVTMLDYSESQGSEYNTPTDGNEFVLVEFEIVNNSDNELAISSALSFKAYADDYALNYSLAAQLEKEGATQLDGTIAPGKKMKGVVGYEVPTDWSTMEIHFTDNVWSSGKFKFEINK